MKLTAPMLLDRFTKAQSRKGIWDNRYEEVFKYTMPDRDNYYNNDNASQNGAQGEDKRPYLYTSTGEQSADAFVNRIQSILTPIGANWIGLEASSLSENAEKINEQLDMLSELANGFKEASNFDAVISEFYYDLLAGTACMLLLEGDFNNPLNFRPIPIKQIVLDEGVDGEVASVYRKFSLPKEVVKHQWIELEKMEITQEELKNNTMMELVESVYKDYDTGKFHYRVIDEKNKKYLVEREYNTNPFIVLRWSKCPGEEYGRGLGMKALHDLQSLNKAVEYSLRSLAFSIPTLLAQQDATIDYDDFLFEPGALNVVPSTIVNNPSIMPLAVNPNVDISQYNIETLKMDIKKTMLDSTLPADAGQPKTATEIAERIQEQTVNITSVFGRLINEFLRPVIRRSFDILQKFGHISDDFDINMIDSFGFKVKVNTPLAKQQSQGEIQNIMYAVSTLAQFDPTMQTASQVLKLNDLMSYAMDQMGVPNRFVNSPDEIQQMQQAQAEAQQAMQQQAMADDVASENAKAQGKEDAKS